MSSDPAVDVCFATVTCQCPGNLPWYRIVLFAQQSCFLAEVAFLSPSVGSAVSLSACVCVGLSPFIILLSHTLLASPAPDSRKWSVCERWNSEPHLQATPLLLRPSTVPQGSWLVCCFVAWAVFWGSWIPGQPLEVASLFAAGFLCG